MSERLTDEQFEKKTAELDGRGSSQVVFLYREAKRARVEEERLLAYAGELEKAVAHFRGVAAALDAEFDAHLDKCLADAVEGLP